MVGVSLRDHKPLEAPYIMLRHLDGEVHQFSREATSTVSRVQGTGLGLSISKAIVDMMGGSISVESKSGKGSKFTISLCFKVTDETTDNKTISSNSIIDTNKKILLVEDNELNFEIAKTVLE